MIIDRKTDIAPCQCPSLEENTREKDSYIGCEGSSDGNSTSTTSTSTTSSETPQESFHITLCEIIALSVPHLAAIFKLCRTILDLRTHLTQIKMNMVEAEAENDEFSSTKLSLKQNLADLREKCTSFEATNSQLEIQIQSDQITLDFLETEKEDLSQQLLCVVRSGY